MTKDEIIAKLLEHRAELEAAGAEHVSIFGAVARRENRPDSDLGILLALSEPVGQSGFGYFSALLILTEKIAAITGFENVDVVAEPLRREAVRARIEKDRALAF